MHVRLHLPWILPTLAALTLLAGVVIRTVERVPVADAATVEVEPEPVERVTSVSAPGVSARTFGIVARSR